MVTLEPMPTFLPFLPTCIPYWMNLVRHGPVVSKFIQVQLHKLYIKHSSMCRWHRIAQKSQSDLFPFGALVRFTCLPQVQAPTVLRLVWNHVMILQVILVKYTYWILSHNPYCNMLILYLHHICSYLKNWSHHQ